MTHTTTIKPEKKEAVAKLSESMKSAKSIVIVDYSGVGMSMFQELRNRLHETGGKFLVSKNTFTKLAGVDAGLDKEALSDDVLSGQTAILFADTDAVSPIQVIGNFIKEFKLLKFKAGVVEGNFQDETNLIAISKLPTKEILTSQAIGAIGAPLYGLAGTLRGNLQKLVFILKSKVDQGGD